MASNFSNTKADFSNTMTTVSPLRTTSQSARIEATVPAPIMWWFLATAVAVFLMVFSGRLVGDAAGYCLLTVIVIGLMLFRSGKSDDEEAEA